MSLITHCEIDSEMNPGIVKHVPLPSKITITVKINCSRWLRAWQQTFDSCCFHCENPRQWGEDSISSSLPFIQYLFQSLSHMLIILSHLHPNDFALPFKLLSDPSIKLSGSFAPSHVFVSVSADFSATVSVAGFFHRSLFSSKGEDFNSFWLIYRRASVAQNSNSNTKGQHSLQ